MEENIHVIHSGPIPQQVTCNTVVVLSLLCKKFISILLGVSSSTSSKKTF